MGRRFYIIREVKNLLRRCKDVKEYFNASIMELSRRFLYDYVLASTKCKIEFFNFNFYN